MIDGEEFTFVKFIDDEGQIAEIILDAEGEPVSRSALPRPQSETIGESLRATIDRDEGTELANVLVALREPTGIGLPEWTEGGTVTLDDRGLVEISLNGTVVSPTELERNDAARQAHIDAYLAQKFDARRATLRELAARHPEFADLPALREAIERGDPSVVLPMRSDAIEQFLADNADIVVALELADRPVVALAAAMQDTQVDPHAIHVAGRRGGGIGVYMSEAGCPNPGHIANYTRISGNSDAHSMNVSAIIRGVSPESWVYCRSGFTLPSPTDLLGSNGNPRVHIQTHSWSYALSDSDDYTIPDRDFDNHVYDTAVAVFTSAGNFGLKNGYASSPAKALNVIAVGNYDDALDWINPSSGFRDSEIDNEKPELSAPGTFICAGGFCYTGTSQASPHAAGFAADLSGAYAWLRLRPSYLEAVMLAGSDKFVVGGLDKVGLGGLNFYRAFFNGTNSWYEGANNSFANFDAGDPVPNNGHIDRRVFLDAAIPNVRVAISWLNRGSWTYEHRADALPLGMDFDLCVYDPVGALKGCSLSFENSFELLSFDPTITGNYTVRITRFSNNDVASKLALGLAIDWN